MANSNLTAADDFYTQLTDIEKELLHYREHFRGKVVYCNCGDSMKSNFFKYFTLNFEYLGLKKLIAISYCKGGHGLLFEYTGDKNGNHRADLDEVDIYGLHGDGDFRSSECLALLREADVVVTNPPFTLIREYIALLMEYNKKFLILGTQKAVLCKDIFPLIRDSKMWYGVSISGGDRAFFVPDNYELNACGCGIDDTGHRFIRVKGVRWFTNLEHGYVNEPIDLYKKYNDSDYPKYDNYDAIEVSKVTDIPADYDGVMGVPISFIDKWCPYQFEIVGFRKGDDGKDLSVNGKCPYTRILIRHK